MTTTATPENTGSPLFKPLRAALAGALWFGLAGPAAAALVTLDFDGFAPGAFTGPVFEDGFAIARPTGVLDSPAADDPGFVDIGGGDIGVWDSLNDGQHNAMGWTIGRDGGGLFKLVALSVIDLGGLGSGNTPPRFFKYSAVVDDAVVATVTRDLIFGFNEPVTVTVYPAAQAVAGIAMDTLLLSTLRSGSDHFVVTSVTLRTVPVPTTLPLLGIGLLAMASGRRSRREAV
jgi:hypothetical protein